MQDFNNIRPAMSVVITETFSHDAIQLASVCRVVDPISNDSVEGMAIWDTGASRTTISMKIAQSLNLPITGATTSQTAAGPTHTNMHVVNLKIGNVTFQKIAVSSPVGMPDNLVLIGMDIIGIGKFTVSNEIISGKLQKVLTLEIP